MLSLFLFLSLFFFSFFRVSFSCFNPQYGVFWSCLTAKEREVKIRLGAKMVAAVGLAPFESLFVLAVFVARRRKDVVYETNTLDVLLLDV